MIRSGLIARTEDWAADPFAAGVADACCACVGVSRWPLEGSPDTLVPYEPEPARDETRPPSAGARARTETQRTDPGRVLGTHHCGHRGRRGNASCARLWGPVKPGGARAGHLWGFVRPPKRWDGKTPAHLQNRPGGLSPRRRLAWWKADRSLHHNWYRSVIERRATLSDQESDA